MFKVKMKLTGTMRGIPAPTQEITRCFNTLETMVEYLSGLLGNPLFDLKVEYMNITQE